MENQLPSLLLLLLLVPSGVCGPELQLDVGTEAPLGGTARLRCRYTGAAQVTQVTWDKLTDLGPQMVAVRSDAHGTRTHPFYGARARFQRGDEHGGGALDGDASLLIHQLVLADAGRFRCKVFTFPAGSFEGDTGLTVLVPPQVWLVPSPRALLEGDRHALVATCMVMGSTPLPQVWWDTAVEGEQEMTNTANANGTVTVTSSLYVHPERDMKGKDAVCTVNHSSLAQPLHVPYKLNVYHVPEVMIKRSSENWQADMEGAALQCEENGNPPATGFVWTRMGDPLPSNLTQDGSRLLFTKRLTMEDSGTYVCEVSNEIGSRSAKMKITISDPNVAEMSLLTLAFVAIGVVGLVLVLIFIGAMIAVNRSHRKKTEQMVFKLEEISTMSRQPSIRRCNSMSASVDVRLQEAGGSRDIDQLELEPMMEEMVPPQRSSSRDLLAVSVGGQVQPLPLGTHRYSLRSTTSEPRYSPAYPFGAYRNSLPSNQRHSLREWVLNHSERSGSPGDVPEISSRELTAALEQVSSLSPRPLTPSPSEQGSQTEDEEEVADRQKSIHAAMGHFYPHNGTLRAKPGSSTVYIARREHCV